MEALARLHDGYGGYRLSDAKPDVPGVQSGRQRRCLRLASACSLPGGPLVALAGVGSEARPTVQPCLSKTRNCSGAGLLAQCQAGSRVRRGSGAAIERNQHLMGCICGRIAGGRNGFSTEVWCGDPMVVCVLFAQRMKRRRLGGREGRCARSRT